jgi:DNA-binding NtrC family response regulator
MIKAKVLIIDDNKNILKALEILLQFEFEKIETISNPNQITSYPNLQQIDLILLDMNFSAGINTGNEGLFWLKKLKQKAPNASIIMMTAYGAVELAVEALKSGAADFVLKPWNNEKLIATLKSAYQLKKSKAEVSELKQKENQLKQMISQRDTPLIGSSVAFLSALKTAQKIAKTDVNVIITGENGTGKELFARELHSLSKRSEEIFVSVDLGSIVDSLFESELFGHLKGAFTDAKEDRIGKFEAAIGGTLFLDEIGNLSMTSQAKLLSAIQNKSIVKVGSNIPIPVDIRLICATNCNLEEMVKQGLFREDLLYRINTINISLPSLKERENDIIILAQTFIDRFSKKYDKVGIKLNKSAEEKLMSYKWPGNVRELQHAIERAILLADTNILGPSDFPFNQKEETINELNINTIDEMEKLMIAKALEKHNQNYTAAANELGVTRQTLYNKVKKLDA